MSAEFQRIARRDKIAFLSDQCKEKKENSRMGNNRNLKVLTHCKKSYEKPRQHTKK